MPWTRTSTTGEPPADPLGDAMAAALADVIAGAAVELTYTPTDAPPPAPPVDAGTASATGPGPRGWHVTVTVRLEDKVAQIVRSSERSALAEILDALPRAGIRAADRLRRAGDDARPLGPALRRALRDAVAAEALGAFLASRIGGRPRYDLVGETIEYLIELSGTRVESHDLTHGVVVTDVLQDTPRLHLAYPADIRSAKRAPLLFDGQRSVLVIDPAGQARTELQRHRFGRLTPAAGPPEGVDDGWIQSGSLVAAATGVLGGLGFYVRADRSIWTFVDGQPLLVRRREHWTAFPLELTAAIVRMIGRCAAASLVARAAFMISAQPRSGAILAIVDDPADLEGVVSLKDRYDLRDEIDREAMRPETRLHHLIDAEHLDEQTLVRLATLDGATVLSQDGRLVAYGAIVSSADSEHEGARTAAAKSLSGHAEVVLKVSVDGDITIFRGGQTLKTLLGRPRWSRH